MREIPFRIKFTRYYQAIQWFWGLGRSVPTFHAKEQTLKYCACGYVINANTFQFREIVLGTQPPNWSLPKICFCIQQFASIVEITVGYYLPVYFAIWTKPEHYIKQLFFVASRHPPQMVRAQLVSSIPPGWMPAEILPKRTKTDPLSPRT